MKKHPYEYIKSQFEKEGYKLLSKKYIDALSKLKAKCPNGHNYKVKYGNFYQGQDVLFVMVIKNLLMNM